MKQITKIILLITLAILPMAFAQAQVIKRTKKKAVKTKRTIKRDEPLVPEKVSTAPNTVKARPQGVFTIGNVDREPASETFKTETINKHAIESLSVPSNMTAEEVKERKTKNGEVEWTEYLYEWKTYVAEKYSEPRLKAQISSTVFNIDLKTWAIDVPMELRTPEGLVKAEHFRNEKESRLKEAKIINVDGVDGAYATFDDSSGNFVASWQTYRLLDGKAQRIDITIKGVPAEFSKAERIIKSFKLAVK